VQSSDEEIGDANYAGMHAPEEEQEQAYFQAGSDRSDDVRNYQT
jgi:hypothetical protein